MGKCPSCGASSIFGISTKKCIWCHKEVCSKCVPEWHGNLSVKIHSETVSAPAVYETVGFCSDKCFHQFWQKVLEYPMEYHIGTNINNFNRNWIRLWNDSIVKTFSASSANAAEIVAKINRALQIHTERFPAFPWWDSSGKPTWMATKSSQKSRLTLAQNLEKCGRLEDAARTYEELHMYDNARGLREKGRHIILKKTDISVNLNSLLQQVKDGGIVVVYRCPHCGGSLKIGKETNTESLQVCQYCGSEIKAIDVADFLKTALS